MNDSKELFILFVGLQTYDGGSGAAGNEGQLRRGCRELLVRSGGVVVLRRRGRERGRKNKNFN
jgi:hypothetical protein